MGNSSLVCYTAISPHKKMRNHKIDTISIHCMACNGSVEVCGRSFQGTNVASSNYGIGSDGRIALYVPEEFRSMCTSSSKNDNRAITIEVANLTSSEPFPISEKAYNSLISLLVDICKRNGIEKLLWKADKNLIGEVEKQNMTVHRWFAAKSCPGEYLYNKHYQIAEDVNERLEKEMNVRYQNIYDVPEPLREETKELIESGALKGNEKGLDVTEDMLRCMIINKRYTDNLIKK